MLDDYKIQKTSENEYRIVRSSDSAIGGLIILAIIGIVVLFKHLSENTLVQKFFSLSFHQFFKTVLIIFLLSSVLLWIFKKLNYEDENKEKSRIFFLLGILFSVWIVLGIFKGFKYHYFSEMGFFPAVLYGLKSIMTSYRALFVSGVSAGSLNMFMAVMSIILFIIRIIQLLARSIYLLLTKIPVLSKVINGIDNDTDVGNFFYTGMKYIILSWGTVSAGAVIWLLV